MPIERIMPAIPGSVSVKSKAFKSPNIKPTYKVKAMPEATPEIR